MSDFNIQFVPCAAPDGYVRAWEAFLEGERRPECIVQPADGDVRFEARMKRETSTFATYGEAVRAVGIAIGTEVSEGRGPRPPFDR